MALEQAMGDKITDTAGNADASPASRAWTVQTPPLVDTSPVMKLPSKATTPDNTPNIRAKVSDGQANLKKSYIKLFVDKKRKKTFNYSVAKDKLAYTSKNLKNGKHKVKIMVTDPNRKDATKTFTIKIK